MGERTLTPIQVRLDAEHLRTLDQIAERFTQLLQGVQHVSRPTALMLCFLRGAHSFLTEDGAVSPLSLTPAATTGGNTASLTPASPDDDAKQARERERNRINKQNSRAKKKAAQTGG
jgi:hypothetical protein